MALAVGQAYLYPVDTAENTEVTLICPPAKCQMVLALVIALTAFRT